MIIMIMITIVIIARTTWTGGSMFAGSSGASGGAYSHSRKYGKNSLCKPARQEWLQTAIVASALKGRFLVDANDILRTDRQIVI